MKEKKNEAIEIVDLDNDLDEIEETEPDSEIVEEKSSKLMRLLRTNKKTIKVAAIIAGSAVLLAAYSRRKNRMNSDSAVDGDDSFEDDVTELIPEDVDIEDLQPTS